MIPNLLRSFLGEGALNTTFIPIFSEHLAQKNQKSADYFASNVLNILLITLVIITVSGILGAPWIVNIIANGFQNQTDKFALTVQLTRIMFPYIFFVAIAAMFMGILNTYRSFFIPAFAPAMLNISIIILAFFYASHWGIYSLGIGVLLGGMAQMLIHIPSLIRKQFHYRLFVDLSDPGIQKFFHLLLPAILGLGITKINVVVDRIIASFLVNGSISALYFANRLMQFPLGVFGIALSIAILPTLSFHFAKNNFDKLKDSFSFGLKMLSLSTVPSTIGLIVLSQPIIRLFYEHGRFNAQDTSMTVHALVYYALGLFAVATLRLVTSTFYSLQDTRTPLKIGSLIVIINIILDLLLVQYMAHAGIALATSLSAIINLTLLGMALHKKVPGMFSQKFIPFFLKILSISLVMGFGCWFSSFYLGQMLDLSVKINQVAQVFLSILIGLFFYLTGGKLLGISEFKNIRYTIRKLIKGKINEDKQSD